jgi:hypothetical protein
MNPCKKKILVIGSGIHGITLSLELSKDYDVTVIDGNHDILMGASNGTHNRIHLGYHYPRSVETISECKSGYDFFVDNYKSCLRFPEFYYVIEKDSFTSAEDFRKVMVSQGLPCETEFPEIKYLNRELIVDSFKVKEACFDLNKLRIALKSKLQLMSVNHIPSFEIKGYRISGKTITLKNSLNEELDIEVDIIVNCTYTYSNNLLQIFGIENFTEYEFEQTEISVVESDFDIPALTVMDGPFISILPYGDNKNQYIVYDVENSVRSRKTGYFFEFSDFTKTSNWSKIYEHGLKYYPFFKDLRYSHSIYSHRPIPKNIDNDSRATRIVKEDFEVDFYSIKEGKFISAPSIAVAFKKMIDENGK